MNADETIPADAPIAPPDPHRFADGGAPGAVYVALPDEPTETVAIAGSANDSLSSAETGAFDSDD
ncbi:MAG: hypothetical protein Q7J04_06270 [Microcella sp.]|nr:hypothetical protein [Microcella sp.]